MEVDFSGKGFARGLGGGTAIVGGVGVQFDFYAWERDAREVVGVGGSIR